MKGSASCSLRMWGSSVNSGLGFRVWSVGFGSGVWGPYCKGAVLYIRTKWGPNLEDCPCAEAWRGGGGTASFGKALAKEV